MRPRFFLFVCCSCLISAMPADTASADDGLSPETLAAVKRATVFVEIEVEKLTGSGSGFVVRVDKDTALIVTNHHVVQPTIIGLINVQVPPPKSTRPTIGSSRRTRTRLIPVVEPRLIVKTFKNAAVTVVFDSGTRDERSVKAELLAMDPENDLAVIRVKDVKNLPAPIKFETPVKLIETMSVYTFGFPFGKDLATTKGHPAITVTKVGISSLREDEAGELSQVQLDGGVDPGNSGGPVVNGKGELVGVAAAAIRNSSGIGMAIPAGPLKNVFAGRIGDMHLANKPNAEKPALAVEVAVIDPLNKIASVELHSIGASQVKADGDKEVESLEGLPGVGKMKLTLEKQLATGEMSRPGSGSEKELLLQAVYTTTEGKTKKSRVSRLVVPALPVVPTPPAVPAPPVIAKTTPAEKPAAPTEGFGPIPGKEKVESSKPKSTKTTPGAVRARTEKISGGETKVFGGAFQAPFRDEAPDNGRLIGLEVSLGQFANIRIVKAVRPIYLTDKGEVNGEQHGAKLKNVVTIKAKEGYAVGGMTVRAGLMVNGLSFTFMRLKEGTLDPTDSYESDWVGDRTGGSETILKGNGTPVIGFIGKGDEKECWGVGLLLDKK